MASTYITRTPSTGGNRTKWTWSSWIKIDGSGDGTYQYLLNCYYGNQYRYTYFCYRNGRIEMYGGDYQTSSSAMSFDVSTKRLLRDASGWYHIVVAFDSTQSTSTDRIKLWINGVRETEFISYDGSSSATFPAQNDETFNNTSITPMHIGQNFNGSMSHIHYTDGYSYQASDFGETDSTTGEWKIKTSPSISNYGVNGFWILKDGNSLTDQSSNSNNYSLGGGTLTNTEDCPSNVFCTLNPLDKAIIGTQPTLANGNTKWTASGNSSSNCAVRGTIGDSSGKYYFETKLLEATQTMVGVHLSSVYPWYDSDGYIGNNSGFYGIYSNGSDNLYAVVAGSNQATNLGSVTNNDILGCAFDFDNNKYYFSKNGSWLNSGDPTSGSTGTGSFGTLASGLYIPAISNVSYNISSSAVLNFGNGYFGTTAVSSAGTNASGNGIFEYDVPTGFTALSTKGLNL